MTKQNPCVSRRVECGDKKPTLLAYMRSATLIATICLLFITFAIMWWRSKPFSTPVGKQHEKKSYTKESTIPISYIGESLFLVIPVELDSKTLWTILDTASTTVFFRERVPKAAYEEIGEEGTVRFLMYETEVPTQRVRLRARIADEKYTFLGAHLIRMKHLPPNLRKDLDKAIGIIGIEFLRNQNRRFRITKESLTILPSSANIPTTAIPFSLNSQGHIQFETAVSQNGTTFPVSVVFDTGAGLNQPVVLHPRIASRIALNAPLTLNLRSSSLRISRYGIQKRAVYDTDLIIGASVLRNYEVWIDFPHRKIWFEKCRSSKKILLKSGVP